MLIPVTVMPVVFGLLDDAPETSHPSAAPLSALATVLVTAGVSLNARGPLRLWAPLIGVVSGSVVAGFFGLYDFERVATAPWMGYPAPQWPGFDLDFGREFWALLPAFALVALVGTLRTMSSCVAVQGVSWRRRRAATSSHRAARGCRRDARVRRRSAGGEPPGPDRAARERERRDPARAGGLPAAAAAPRVLGAPPAVPRHGCLHRQREGSRARREALMDSSAHRRTTSAERTQAP